MLNLKVPVMIVLAMVFNVFLDHLIGNIPGRPDEVSDRPEMFAPIALLQFRKLLLYVSGRLALQILHQFGNTQIWQD